MSYQIKYSKVYLFKLSIPIFFANLAIPLVGLVDTGLMGHLSNESYLAAASIATSVITMLFWSFGFLRMGTAGLISQEYGKKNYKEIGYIIIHNLTIAFYIGLIIILAKIPLVYAIEFFFKSSPETLELINRYISIRVFSAPAELVIYVLIGVFLGLQKTIISSTLVIFFCFSNIAVSAFFVIIMDFDIAGVAMGTLISAYTTAIVFLAFAYIYLEKYLNITLTFTKIFVRKRIIKLFNINLDIFIRTLLLTFAFLWVTYKSSQLGESFLAINTILLQFIILASFFLDAYAFSTEAVIGYTVGKKSKKAFLKTVSNTFQLSIFTGLIISLVFLIFYKLIVNTLTDLDHLIFVVYSYIFWIIIIPPFASFCYQFDGIFIGASQTAEMRNGMFISVFLFIITSIFLTKHFGNHGLWAALLFFMIMRSLTLNFYFNKILKKF